MAQGRSNPTYICCLLTLLAILTPTPVVLGPSPSLHTILLQSTCQYTTLFSLLPPNTATHGTGANPKNYPLSQFLVPSQLLFSALACGAFTNSSRKTDGSSGLSSDTALLTDVSERLYEHKRDGAGDEEWERCLGERIGEKTGGKGEEDQDDNDEDNEDD